MKSAVFVAVLFACLTVSMAKSTKRCKKILPKVQAKLSKFTELSEPKTCSNGSCQITTTKMKNGCEYTKTLDYSGCSAEDVDGEMTINMSNNCTSKRSTTTKPCLNEKKQSKRGYMKQFLEYKVEILQHCANGCSYKESEDEDEDQCLYPAKKILMKEEGGDECPETLEKPCPRKAKKAGGQKGKKKQNSKKNKRGKKWGKNKKRARRPLRRGQDCKYRKGIWNECDPTTGKQLMERSLKRGDPDSCQPIQITERPCRKKARNGACKYRRTKWSECDGITNVKTMVMTLKRGKPGQCNTTRIMEKICKRKHMGLRGSGCKYSRGIWSECDLATGKQSMQRPLKPGSQPMCPPTKFVQRPCKEKSRKRADKCKYRKNGRWSPCDVDSNTKSRNMVLVRGNPKICPVKKELTKPCRKRSKKTKACKYDKRQWGPCNAATNTVTRTLTLKDGDPSVCNKTRTDVRKCKDKHLRPHVCKYRRTTWGECDPSTNMKKMIKTLKRGDPSQCVPTETVEKKCKRKNKGSACKYRFEPWSPCSNTTNTMTRREILESGPSLCQPVKEFSRKCKKPCSFINGEWSACDPVTNQMTKVDILRPGSADYCNKTRILSKKCGKKGKRCVYTFGEWSECDESASPKRSRLQTLVSGGENCDQRKIVTKPCKKPNGEVRCFFGPWQEYEACQNGVQKKHRQVLQGGLECERKGVKMKSC